MEGDPERELVDSAIPVGGTHEPPDWGDGRRFAGLLRRGSFRLVGRTRESARASASPVYPCQQSRCLVEVQGYNWALQGNSIDRVVSPASDAMKGQAQPEEGEERPSGSCPSRLRSGRAKAIRTGRPREKSRISGRPRDRIGGGQSRRDSPPSRAARLRAGRRAGWWHRGGRYRRSGSAGRALPEGWPGTG